MRQRRTPSNFLHAIGFGLKHFKLAYTKDKLYSSLALAKENTSKAFK
ncbi:MAG TPA: hypothetical protein VJR94_06075 [Candidatus Nitrosocosmicus sp.]|nr:hypothetical protein [Candidatus Nitrosocosmicus sp.]